jgi:formylglycine-generating enzyme required for sulfatase activity
MVPGVANLFSQIFASQRLAPAGGLLGAMGQTLASMAVMPSDELTVEMPTRTFPCFFAVKSSRAVACPVDYETGENHHILNLSSLLARLARSRAGVNLALLDCCRLDAEARALARARALAPDIVRVPRNLDVIWSCSEGEGSFEYPFSVRGGTVFGVFLFFVCEALDGAARNSDGTVNWDDLTSYVRRRVPQFVEKHIATLPQFAHDKPTQNPHPVNSASREAVLAYPRGDDRIGGSQGKGGEAVTNSFDMKLQRIPAGRFDRGSPTGEKNREDDEGPRRQVQITKDFWVGIHEVTQQQFKLVMGYNPSHFSSQGAGKEGVFYPAKPGGSWRGVGKDTSDFPVENVSWEEAVEFCRRLSERREEKSAGRSYRLPTEAEWEYACRAGTTTPFALGAALTSTQANFDGTHPYGGAAAGPFREATTKVGSFKPNGWGLFDMHGNVWEWCADWYDDSYYAKSPGSDPPGPVRGSGPAQGAGRVIRGGSWWYEARFCRTRYRGWAVPSVRRYDIGFRVVMESTK